MKLNLGMPQQLKLKQIRRSSSKSGWSVDPKPRESSGSGSSTERIGVNEFKALGAASGVTP